MRVPLADPAAVRRDLEELKNITEAALSEVLARVGWGQPVAGKNCHKGIVNGTHPRTPCGQAAARVD